MKMCTTIPTFILLFTGYFVKNMHVHATESSLLEAPTPHATEAYEQETAAIQSKAVTTYPETGLSPVPEKSFSSAVVSGISISLVIILVFIFAFLWFKWKWSKGSSAEINSVPSSEAVVTLKNTKL